MKLTELDLGYIEYLCKTTFLLLQKINKEEGYIYHCENKARFERLRIELNKALIKANKIFMIGEK